MDLTGYAVVSKPTNAFDINIEAFGPSESWAEDALDELLHRGEGWDCPLAIHRVTIHLTP